MVEQLGVSQDAPGSRAGDEARARCGACACGSQPHVRDALGSPSVPTKWDCLQWLDAGRTNAGESLRDQRQAQESLSVRAPEARSRGAKPPLMMERRKARVSPFARRCALSSP